MDGYPRTGSFVGNYEHMDSGRCMFPSIWWCMPLRQVFICFCQQRAIQRFPIFQSKNITHAYTCFETVEPQAKPVFVVVEYIGLASSRKVLERCVLSSAKQCDNSVRANRPPHSGCPRVDRVLNKPFPTSLSVQNVGCAARSYYAMAASPRALILPSPPLTPH